jgi:hypothetical protein
LSETSMIDVKVMVLLVAALFIITVIFTYPICHIHAQSLQITPTPDGKNFARLTASTTGSSSSTVCLNFGDNSADIHK